MANTIANQMINDGHTEDEVLSTTLALLCSGTATLGLVLVAMGYFKLADAVSYLPMPVVGGYLAFIGYFCVQAGTALCISQPMMSIVDWKLLADPKNLLLAFPGLAAGLVLTLTSRIATNSGVLPMVMVIIPAIFYLIIWICGSSLDQAREEGWVGETSPPVLVSELLHLIDFRQVRWDLIGQIIPTWFGMVFVVSFASCLDVAAISIDMGQPLETNRYVP
jgi:SulP family sulfate permease